MGGNKSKPIVESAKTVISRRKKLPTEEVLDGISTPTSSGAVNATSESTVAAAAAIRPPGARVAPNVIDQGYVRDSTILKEMSKWDVVKTTNVKVV